jgi:hypothetical protein
MPKFRTTVHQAEGMNATGLEVPEKIVTALGPGKKHKVTVGINGYVYRSTVAVYSGRYFLPLAKEHRDAAGVKAKDKVEVTLELDTAPREVDLPKDFAAALKKAGARAAFDKLAFTHRKEHVRSIEEAKAPETRARRIEKSVAMVLAGKK